jgi:hypothetical protein
MSRAVVTQIQRVEEKPARVVNKRVYDDTLVQISNSATARGD